MSKVVDLSFIAADLKRHGLGKGLSKKLGNFMSVITRLANNTDREYIKDLYQEWGQAFQHSLDDQYFVAEHDGLIIAAVRLSFENQVFVLRGLYVREEYRYRGVAKSLLQLVSDELGIAETFSLALIEHEKLLARFGFQKIAGLTAPDFLLGRRDSLRENGQDAVLVKRSSGLEARTIGVDDLTQAMSLIQEFELPGVNSLSSNDIRTIFNKITAGGGAVLAVFRGKQMIGTCTVNICANLSWSGRPYSIIENIIVTKTERNRGVGKYLLLFAKHLAASKNCYKIALMTREKTTESTAFYKSAGFADDRIGYQMRFGA